MSQYRCTQCGHLLSGDEVEAHGRLHQSTDWGDSGPAGAAAPFDLIVDLSDEPNEPTETSVTKGPGQEPTINWAVAALLAVAVGLIGWSVLGLRDDAEAFREDPEAAAEEDPDELGGGPDPSGDPELLPSDDHLAANTIALAFQDLIDDGEQRFTVVYPTVDGLQMLSAAGSTTPEVSVAFGFEQMARFPLISDGSKTWAVDPEDPTTSYLVSTQFVVVDTALEGRVAFIDTSRDPVRVGISSFGAWGAGFDVPDSSEILPVPGRGLLIVPKTGGTFIVTATGVDAVSQDSAVAASTNSEIYQRCDEALACDLYMTSPTNPDGLQLDLRVGSDVSISPDGRYVAALTGDQQVAMVDIDSDTSWSVNVALVQGMGWAPDGSFLAVTTPNELIIVSTDDRSAIYVPLPARPSAETVLVVSAPA